MLLEPKSVIDARIDAAKAWIEWFNEEYTEGIFHTDKAQKALLVLILDEKNSKYFAEHDPKALAQAQRAVSSLAWEDF